MTRWGGETLPRTQLCRPADYEEHRADGAVSFGGGWAGERGAVPRRWAAAVFAWQLWSGAGEGNTSGLAWFVLFRFFFFFPCSYPIVKLCENTRFIRQKWVCVCVCGAFCLMPRSNTRTTRVTSASTLTGSRTWNDFMVNFNKCSCFFLVLFCFYILHFFIFYCRSKQFFLKWTTLSQRRTFSPHTEAKASRLHLLPIHWCSSDHEHTPAAGDYVFPGEEEEVQVSGALHTGGADSSAFRQRSAFLQDPAGWWWGLCHLVIQVFTTHHFLVIRQSLPEVNLPQSWTMSFLPLFICWHCAVFSKQCSTRLCYIQVVNVCLLVVFHLRFGKRNWHQPLVQYVLLHPCVSWECCLHDGSPPFASHAGNCPVLLKAYKI